MGVNAMEIRVYTLKTLKACYSSAYDHPFVVGMLFFFFFLYRFLPFLFFFLVSSSPVIICTAVLLGTLLSYGNPYIPDIEEEDEETRKPHHEISALRSGVVRNELVTENDERFGVVETHIDKSRDVNEKDLIFPGKPHKDDGSISGSSDEFKETEMGIGGEKRVIEEFDEEKPLIEGENDVVEYSNISEKEIEGEEGENFSSVLYSSISKGIEGNGGSSVEGSSDYDSDSDRAESSSPDASMAEIMPMLDELHPLLDSEPQPAVVSLNEDAASEESQSSDESEDVEVENAEIEDDEDEEEEEEQQGGHKDGTEAVVTWTKEDEKNLMDLGNSELERNRRLESLIARRRARKNFRMMMTEKNLIDLDGVELPFQISPISTARRNPFDLHYDSNEGMDLPPIPGSAPSVLAPRRNPFDIPYDPHEERPNLAGGSFDEEFFTSHEKDMHFRRYESFSVGSSFFGESKQEKLASKLRPVFVPEQLNSERVGYPTFQRQMSEISESKMSSVTETESVSSDSDQDNHKHKTEQEVTQPIPHAEQESSQLMPHVEQELSQPIPHVEFAPDHVKLESSSSEDIDTADIDQEYLRDDVADEEHARERELTSPEIESMASPMGSDATDVHVKPEVVAEKHTELSSSSSSDVNEMLFHVSTSEGLENLESKTDDTVGNHFTQPSIEVSNLRNEVEEGDDSQMKEPVYDWNWSPSEVEKTLSGISIIEEALSYIDKRVLTSTSSGVSEMHVEALEVGSNPVQVERTSSSTHEEPLLHYENIEEEMASTNEGPWAASLHLNAVEENELRSREVTMINEHDDINAGFSGDNQNDDVTAPITPLVSEQVVVDSGSYPSETELEDGNSLSKEASVQLEQDQVLVSSSSFDPVHVDDPQSNVDVESLKTSEVSSEATHIMLEMPRPLLEKPTTHSSADGDHEVSKEPSSPVAVSINEGNSIHDSCDVVHEPSSPMAVSSSALVPCEISKNEPPTREVNFVEDLHDEMQTSRYFEDLGNSNVSQIEDEVETDVEIADKEFNVTEGITELDEGLLTELDAVGDFGVQGLERSTEKMENLLGIEEQESCKGLTVIEAETSKDVEDECRRTHDSVEALTSTQGHEARSIEVHSTPNEHSINEMELEDEPKTIESEDGSEETSAKLLESAIEVKSDSEELMMEKTRTSGEEKTSEAEETCETSGSSTTDESKKKTEPDASETSMQQTENILVDEVQESLTGMQILDDDSSKDVEVNFLETQVSMEAPRDLQDLEAMSVEEVHVTPKQLFKEQLKPTEDETSAGELETARDVKLKSEVRTNVELSDSDAYDVHETSSSSRTHESEEKQELEAVDAINVELETTESEDVGVPKSLTESSKDVEDNYDETKDSIEDTLESAVEVQQHSQNVLAEENEPSANLSTSEVEGTHEASSSSTTDVKKKTKELRKSNSSSSSSSTSSSSDSE